MIQDHFIILICLFILVISCIVFQYFEITKTKKASFIQVELIHEQIAREKILLKQSNKEVVKIDELEKDTIQKLRILKTKIVTLDFSFKELLECITRS